MAEDFLKVECEECGNQQNIYSRPATEVECLVCSHVIAKPSGGRAEFDAEILRELKAE